MLWCLQDAKQAWEKKRTVNAAPTSGRRRYEAIDVKSFRRHEAYADFYDEGDVMPVDDWLREQNCDPSQFCNEESKVQFVVEVCPAVALVNCLQAVFVTSRDLL